MLMQSILGTCGRNTVLADTGPGSALLTGDPAVFLPPKSSTGRAQNNTGKKESSHGTGMSTSPAVLESGSKKLLSIIIAGKIVLYKFRKARAGWQSPSLCSLFCTLTIHNPKWNYCPWFSLSLLSHSLAMTVHYLCPWRDYQQKRQKLIYLIFFPHT